MQSVPAAQLAPAQPAARITTTDLPAVGEKVTIEGLRPAPFALMPIGTRIGTDIFVGITRNADNTGDIALFLNLEAGDVALPWQKALDWAAAISNADHSAGSYDLPTRKEQALLFANAAEHFESDWYWSNAQYSAYFAWLQDFGHGYQFHVLKVSVYRVRAVRRLPI